MPSPQTTSAMRCPDRALAALRIVVGCWFFKSIFTKIGIVFAFGFLPLPGASGRWIATMPKLLAKYAADNPIAWYKSFLLDTVVANPVPFAHLTALGEVAIGTCLLFGFFTPVGAALGIVQVLFYGFAVQQQSPGQQGFHVMLLAMMIAFLIARAGRTWGVDRWLRARYPDSKWVRSLT